jgi:hypothetical protein
MNSITGNIIYLIPALSPSFTISAFYLNTKKYWWNIKIVKFYLVLRQRKSFGTPEVQNVPEGLGTVT